jgi:hypothetical protein
VRNQIINDAFVYWSDGTVMLGLIYSQKNKTYTGGVFFVSKEGNIDAIGSNVFNMAELLAKKPNDMTSIGEYSDFYIKAHRLFGNFDKISPEYIDSQLSGEYQNYNWFEYFAN